MHLEHVSLHTLYSKRCLLYFFEIFALTIPTCLLVSIYVPSIFKKFCPRFSNFSTFSQKFRKNIFDFFGYYFKNILKNLKIFGS